VFQIDSAGANARRSTGCFHRAAAIPAAARNRLARSPGDHLDETACEGLSDLVEADIAAAIGRRLRKLAKHQSIQAVGGAAPTCQIFRSVADRLHQFRV